LPSFDLTTFSQPIDLMIDGVMELVLDVEVSSRSSSRVYCKSAAIPVGG
jgi:hypothetical protein